jgi:hypothetical protein
MTAMFQFVACHCMLEAVFVSERQTEVTHMIYMPQAGVLYLLR